MNEKIVELKKQYSVKNVKQFRGMEGYGFNATLYKGSIKIADFIDSGDGGCIYTDISYNEAEHNL
jgi:hypothetical protein